MTNRLTLYRKLKDFLAVLVFTDGTIGKIRWRPKLENGYRRPTLREFLDAYYKKE